MLRILYEDNHLIAVFKPAGTLVQGDISQKRCLMDDIKDYLKQKYQKPGNVFLGLIHRLDRPTAGIVLFAKTSKGAARVSEQFRTHTVKKIYQAVVHGVVKEKSKTLVHYLHKNHNTNIVTIVSKNHEGSQLCELSYTLLRTNGKYSLLEVHLKTGRSHQIRAQLSEIGHPIVGDVKYGAPKSRDFDGTIALAAVELHFTTATGSETKTIHTDWDGAKMV